jgi:hypothetical protein
MANVSLKKLSGHLGSACRLVNAAMDSRDEEPELDFEAVRGSLRSALKLLGEGSSGAADRALSRRSSAQPSSGRYRSLQEIARDAYPYRNHP